MGKYSLKSIAEIIQGEILQFAHEEAITELAIDSRQQIGNKSLFFALVTEKNNGHHYLHDAYNKGVRSFVVSENIGLKDFLSSTVIKVADCLQALQSLSAFHRSKFTIPVIGITGSNGKTTVKEWINQLLQDDLKVVKSPKSYNSQVGVPLSVWNMEDSDEIAIFEAGISKKGEMEKLQKIILPTIGIITNIGDAHSENFSSKSEIAAEKMKLFTSCETIIYCKDNEDLHTGITSRFSEKKLISWSTKENATLKITAILTRETQSIIQGFIENKKIEFTVPFIDSASIENCISCWLSLYSLNYSENNLAKKFLHLQQIAMRLEIKDGINNSTLINDTYNSDLHSLKIALQLLAHQYQHSKKTVILSDFVQVYGSKEEIYKKAASLIKENGVGNFIGIGEEIVRFRNFFPKDSDFYSSTREFLQNHLLGKFNGSAVLIKGARKFEFEKITENLQQKSHETVLEVNLSAMVDNFNFFKYKLKKNTKIMAMVKAFSYGAGAHEIANVLQFHNADYLSVAYADEGIELRKSGISTPIMVMNPETESYENMIRHKLEPEIFSFRVLEKFCHVLEENQYYLSGEPYPIHIKLDTGMHRLGFVAAEIEELIQKLKAHKDLKVASLFTHLTSSDEEDKDANTHAQIADFEKMTAQILKSLPYKPLLHILNSSGILRFPEASYDMVRLGIGLYGIAFDKKYKKKLRPLMVLKSTISQIKHLKKGERIGYSGKGIMKADGKTATLPIGYADGLSRKLGNGNWEVQIGEKLYPTIGNICMDMCMIDLGTDAINEGEEVLIFGKKKSIYDFASALEKSAYETLTGIGSRVKRIYFYE